MSIHLITGLPRNGKSYYCVTRIVEDLINEDRGIYTNLPIHPDILCKYVAVQKHDKKNEYYLDLFEELLSRIHIFRSFNSLSEIREFRRKNPVFCRLHMERDRKFDSSMNNEKLLFPFGYLADYWNHSRANSIFYLDECYQIWNYLDSSERSKEAKERRKELQNYMRMHGHDGDDIFLITHKERDLDTFILDTLSYRINVRNSKYWPIIPQEIIDKYWWLSWLGSLRWPCQFFMLRTFIGDEKTPHRSFIKRCNRYIFRCYDSQSRPNGLRNRGYDKQVASSDLGKSYWRELREWFIDSLPALLVLSILIVGAIGVYKGLRSMLHPEPRKTVATAPLVPKKASSVPVKKKVKRQKYYKLLSCTPNTLFFDNDLTIRKGEFFFYEEQDYFVVSVSRNTIVCRFNGRECTFSTKGLRIPETESADRENKSDKIENGNASGASKGTGKTILPAF